jgi:hypothetical protein
VPVSSEPTPEPTAHAAVVFDIDVTNAIIALLPLSAA